MKLSPLSIPGLLRIDLDVFRDARGFFVERFHEEKLRLLGLDRNFVQDNHSFSLPGVLRGLHFQTRPAQGKLIGVLRGKIWDVAVDLRKNSPTFGKHLGIEMSATEGTMLWVPEGFAHGFCVLGQEPADVVYKTTAFYDAPSDGGIDPMDPDLGISWPVKNPLLSPKDAALPKLKDILHRLPERWTQA